MIVVMIAAIKAGYMHLMKTVIVMSVRRRRGHHAVIGEG